MQKECLAKCDECPLKVSLTKIGEWNPVKIEDNGSNILVINEAPGKQESLVGRPFVGYESIPIVEAIEAAGWKRTDLNYTYVVACRYPDGQKNYLIKLKQLNKQRVASGLKPWDTPEECCKPRFEAEVSRHTFIMTHGSVALQAVGVDPTLVTGKKKPSLMDFGGFPTVTRQGTPLLPTLNSAHHTPKDKVILESDVRKARRYFEDRLVNTIQPEVVYKPTVQEFKEFREYLRGKHITSDVETSPYTVLNTEESDGEPLYDGLKDPLRCIGFGTVDRVFIIPFAPVGTRGYFTNKNLEYWFTAYTNEERKEINQICSEIYSDNSITKVGHNFGYYDQLVIFNHFGVWIDNLSDTILWHKLGDSEYLHRLSFVTRMLTDIKAWKAEHTASEAKEDESLYYYCAQDIGATDFVHGPLIARAQQQGQAHLYEKLRLVQRAAVGMHILGLHVDEKKRQEHEDRIQSGLQTIESELRGLAGSINPCSPKMCSRLLYEDLHLPITDYTDSGLPSSDDNALRKLLIDQSTPEDARKIIKLIRRYRELDKQYGTYVAKWKRGGRYVDERGVIRPDYSAHGTVGWRYSSSNPNFQNIPKNLRDCFIAPEGYLLIGADMDQLELRMAAAIAGAGYFIDAFEKNTKDVHNLSGELMFGPGYYKCEGAPEDPRKKGKDKFATRRTLVKKIVFTSLYGGSPQAVLLVVHQDEDDNGDLIYGNMTLKDIRFLQRNWLTHAPEFKTNWNKKFNSFRENGYIEEPVWGLRRFCPNGADFNEIINFEVQGAGGAVVHDAMFSLVFGPTAPIPFEFEKETGLCLQVHDQLVFKVLEKDADRLKDIVQENMTRKYDHLPVTFTADAGIGKRLSEV